MEQEPFIKKEIFKTKNYEYRVGNEFIEVWKKRKLVVSSKILDFRVLYHGKVSPKKQSSQFIFITPTMDFSVCDQYKDIESEKSIQLLLEKISQKCIMDMGSRLSAIFHGYPQKMKKTTCEIATQSKIIAQCTIDSYKNHQKAKRLSNWKKANLIEKKEVKCTCTMCSNVWYISEDRLNKSEGNKIMAIGNLLSGNMMAASYNANNIGNPFECSNCGSSRITKQNIIFYTDKNGNHVNV